ncbi:hypothetical protein DFA_05316 [Cavenderia fasciculata]|uniref:Uncharacterized protein n=1 Tax=Cavenderia fasciculata TaxID=261658 RepID=F4PKW2_CACFS|nr:uncharacterized protein DFA_05316 [Cavenderia fasciculata]EGG23184.1 hypothetical protein DFA_05316 [Cavenderia fasciculata]|eukprot:XP_004361035.1 hypothetical protein DFA_05316 [Cavenderia fasciculata]
MKPSYTDLCNIRHHGFKVVTISDLSKLISLLFRGVLRKYRNDIYKKQRV